MRLQKIIVASVFALGGALSVSSAVGAATPAANARLDESVRCFAVTSILSTMADPEAQKLGQMGGLYFMGRLEGQLTDKELEDRLFAFSQNAANEDTDKILAHCGQLMQDHGKAIAEVGSRVSEREEAAAKAKAGAK